MFIAAAAFLVTGQVRCRSYLQIPALVDLQWTWWPGIWIAIGIATFIGIQNARKKALLVGAPQALLTVCFGIAVGEAAGFHVGAYASRWFAIAIVCVGVGAVIELAASKYSRSGGT